MKAYTDYPKSGEPYRRELREVTLAYYEGDKYIETSDGEFFKHAYVYRNRRRVPYQRETLERRLPNWYDKPKEKES